jgi:hypothetical protein
MTDVASLVTGAGLIKVHSAITWNAPEVLGAWYVTVVKLPAATC